MFESLDRREITPCDPPALHLYRRPPEPVYFPAQEDVPETNPHLEIRTAVYQSVKRGFAERATIGSDQFVYYDPTTARRCLAPDCFVKLGPPHRPFRLWKTWELGAPDLGVEVVSDADAGEAEWNDKLAHYRAAGIRELVRFDREDRAQPIRVWDAVDGDLVERSPEDPRLCVCDALGLFWVVVEHPQVGPMLRLARDPEGKDLLLIPEEAEAVERGANEALRAQVDELRAALLRAEGKRP